MMAKLAKLDSLVPMCSFHRQKHWLGLESRYLASTIESRIVTTNPLIIYLQFNHIDGDSNRNSS